MVSTPYQAKVLERIVALLLEYEDNDNVKIFKAFQDSGGIFYNAKKSIPTSRYPALWIWDTSVGRESFGIKRQDWWVLDIKILMFTYDNSENDMNLHYKWVEGIDRVCRTNPHLHKAGGDDLGIHKADLEDASYQFAFEGNFVISETECSIPVRTKMCLANQIS